MSNNNKQSSTNTNTNSRWYRPVNAQRQTQQPKVAAAESVLHQGDSPWNRVRRYHAGPASEPIGSIRPSVPPSTTVTPTAVTTNPTTTTNTSQSQQQSQQHQPSEQLGTTSTPTMFTTTTTPIPSSNPPTFQSQPQTGVSTSTPNNFNTTTSPTTSAPQLISGNDQHTASGPPMFVEVRLREKTDRENLEREQRRENDAQKEIIRNEQAKKNLYTCKRNFIIGCFGLPLLHFVSFFYFYRELKGPESDFRIRKFILMSLFVGLIQSFAFILWLVVFQLTDSLQKISIEHSHAVVGALVRSLRIN